MRLACLAVLTLFAAVGCSNSCVPDEQGPTFGHRLPVGISVEIPAEYTIWEVHEGIWVRNYCEPNVWLGATWKEISPENIPVKEDQFFESVKSGLSRPSHGGRFVPIASSFEIVDFQQASCVRSEVRLEERWFEDLDVTIRTSEGASLTCMHPLREALEFTVFYYVDDDGRDSLSPQESLGERFLDSLEIDAADNKRFKTDAAQGGAG